MNTVAVIVAGGIGALARYGLAGAVQRATGSSRPWGTAVVNIAGAALLGALIAGHTTGRLNAMVVFVVGTGFGGGFTTFSTWMVESVRLGEHPTARGLLAVTVNLAGMFTAGLAATAVTAWLIRVL